MPTYSYKCTHCDHKFDALQSITAEPISKCPECSQNVVRIIGAGAGILFKGSGFYVTDYKATKTGNTETTGATSNNKTETKTTEAKTASTKTASTKTTETKSES